MRGYDFDIIVVGAGHAGCEAAMSSATMGSKVLLITMDLTKIAQMSCNPAMGGIGKGQLIREIDALGGYSGIVTDRTMIHFRMLNRSKGPAVWSPRAQNDRMLFSMEWRNVLEKNPNISFFQDMVVSLIVENYRCCGVKTLMGYEFRSRAVILTNGTFLNGKIHVGMTSFPGGRIGEKSATGLTEYLVSLGFEAGRFKTGTPPRIDGRTINYSVMEEQKGDEPPGCFSFMTEERPRIFQKSCWITYTNPEVHDIIRKGLKESPLYTGIIQGRGPRYCPSIEDKVVKFPDKERHTIFVEPEGWNTYEVYVNGFSTSLPAHIQEEALRKVPGFENARFIRPGYAIEYDYFPPTQLKPTLETKYIENLFFAGQINGTTGYEEAAAQGIIAGINAHLKINDKEPFILSREQAFIGILINDLVYKGTDEPYRMFTSRAEYRLTLRQDNADIRLTPLAYKLGLASPERMRRLERKIKQIDSLMEKLENTKVSPSKMNGILSEKGIEVKQSVSLRKLLERPELHIQDILPMLDFELVDSDVQDEEVLMEVEINAKYSYYIEKEKELARKIASLDKVVIPEDFDYEKVKGLSFEGREKLMKIRPRTLGDASRISGVSLADITVLYMYLK